MENNTIYIRTDENTFINRHCIRWVKKMNDCLEVCIKTPGCIPKKDTHKICKISNPNSYNKLNALLTEDVVF
jgi:hypothetical protein